MCVFISRNVNHTWTRELGVEAGFGLLADLRKYLRIPVLHNRQSKSTYEYLLDKIRKRLASWKGQNLAFMERLTWAQQVLLALPMYTMQTTSLFEGICQIIQKFYMGSEWLEVAFSRPG